MKNKKSGFTLIELLVVSTIIIILAVIGMVSYSGAAKGARDGKRKADVETIRQAATLYRQQNPAYPASYYQLDMIGSYISEPVPVDPSAAVGYYTYAGGATFCVCADVETDKGNSNNNSCTSWNTTNTGDFYCAKNL